MTTQEINAALGTLTELTNELEQMYIENGGEVTPEAEQLEMAITATIELLKEGRDDLGRWYLALNNTEAAYKAERAAADARIKSTHRTIEYVKGLINLVMDRLGVDKVKGTFYSFSKAESVKSTIDEQALDDAYLSKVLVAARTAGLPDCIDVELKTTTTRLKEAGEEFEQYISVETAPSVRFGKPRAAKE